MVRIFIFSLLVALMTTSCCFVRPTSAQSDRLETHNPFVPVVECIPCSTTRNSPELNLWAEGWGTNNKWMMGIEPGYNANYFRVFADAGSYWWPNGNIKWSHREQIGIVLLDPDLFVRPEIGMGLHQRYYHEGPFSPNPAGVIAKQDPDLFWHISGGLRFNVPYSNMVISTRMYRLENFDGSGNDWNFGLQFACRL